MLYCKNEIKHLLAVQSSQSRIGLRLATRLFARRRSENVEMARHYGNLRFAMYTVFTTIVGALLLLALDKDRGALIVANPLRCLVSLSGIILSIGFILAEIRMSKLIIFYQKVSFEGNELSKPYGHDVWKYIIPGIMISPYVFSVVFWAMFLLGWIAVSPTLK